MKKKKQIEEIQPVHLEPQPIPLVDRPIRRFLELKHTVDSQTALAHLRWRQQIKDAKLPPISLPASEATPLFLPVEASWHEEPVRMPQQPPRYTHVDVCGMPWRFVDGRPRSMLADIVMMDCGFAI